jgi:hypothetical protein
MLRMVYFFFGEQGGAGKNTQIGEIAQKYI